MICCTIIVLRAALAEITAAIKNEMDAAAAVGDNVLSWALLKEKTGLDCGHDAVHVHSSLVDEVLEGDPLCRNRGRGRDLLWGKQPPPVSHWLHSGSFIQTRTGQAQTRSNLNPRRFSLPVACKLIHPSSNSRHTFSHI